jgi:hypothetical protein
LTNDTDQLVTVLMTRDPALVALAKSILDGADIQFFVTGEILQGFGYGVFTEIRVCAEDVDNANQLLEDLATSDL